MTFRVVIQRAAREGISEAYRWLAERSPTAAARWLDGGHGAIASLNILPTRCGLAPESEALHADVRQYTYGRRGGRYRILFIIRGDTVNVIEVRHGARTTLGADDLQFPPDNDPVTPE